MEELYENPDDVLSLLFADDILEVEKSYREKQVEMSGQVYSIVNEDIGKEIASRLQRNRRCIDLLPLTDGGYGKGIYAYPKSVLKYLKKVASLDKKVILELRLRFVSSDILNLASVYEDEDLNKLNGHLQNIKEAGIKIDSNKGLIDAIEKVANEKPRAYFVLGYDGRLVPNTTVCRYTGKKLFIKDLNMIESVGIGAGL